MIDFAGMSSTDSIRRARNSRSSGLQGAKVTPQLPITTEVTPCQHGDVASGSQEICASRCVWMSTKPGVTSAPSASITRPALPFSLPTAAIRSPCTATSARTGSAPVPSTSVPFRIRTSQAMLPPALIESPDSNGIGVPRLRTGSHARFNQSAAVAAIHPIGARCGGRSASLGPR